MDFVARWCRKTPSADPRSDLPSDPPYAIDPPAGPLTYGETTPELPGPAHHRRDTMTINVGDKIPSATLKQLTPEGVKEFTTDEIFRGKKVVLFAVPGAFTPACSQRHLPGYVDKAADIKAKGVDEIACVAVNDAFVMGAWGREQRTEGKVRMLADGSGDFARALGLELDLTKGGLGVRSKRYAMLIDDGIVKSLNVEAQPGQVEGSSAEAMLKAL
jgi:peroxiredoxin